MITTVEKTENQTLQIQDFGLADYRDVLAQQHRLCEKRGQDKIPDTILIAEHPSVITLGARQSANKLLADHGDLAQENIDIVQTRRGGGATAHNPGQLVFYPILHLRQLKLGVNEYIRILEQTGIELLRQLDIDAQRRKGLPGLWVGDRKIASIGVKVSKSVAYHGMAININNALNIFDYLIPCGLDGVEITSVLKETGQHHSMPDVKKTLSQLLTKHFSTSNDSRATSQGPRKLPQWLKRPLPAGRTYSHTESILNSLGLHTICTNANCPNKGQCWDKGTAAVLILGNVCTRNCRFCSVAAGKPAPPDPTEPNRIAKMAKQLGLKYLVLTSVTRDDLLDGGAGHFRGCINQTRQQCPDIKFEILTPDFAHCQAKAVEILSDALPFTFAHNLETVPSLYPTARAGSNYQRSLNLLKTAKQSCPNTPTKSSIMLGLGETDAEVEQVLKDLRNAGCDRITIGQYLKPSKDSLDVVEYITPAKFDFWKQKATELGFTSVQSEPFARSSYFAEKQGPF